MVTTVTKTATMATVIIVSTTVTITREAKDASTVTTDNGWPELRVLAFYRTS